MTPPLVFFLGGNDLEMATIRALAEEHLGPQAVRDRGLGWGARLSDHADTLAALAADQVPVLVELAIDMPLPPGAVIIDHHGPAPQDKTALEQVFQLLGLPPDRWTRHLALVAANDRGHVRALRAMGATDAEIADIRAADRHAQGITREEEDAAQTALAAAEHCLDGRLRVVTLPHGRTATVMDRIAAALPGNAIANVLIFSPGEVNFFGTGPAVAALNAAFPDGFSGGDLPHAGFWGHGVPMPSRPELLGILGGVLPCGNGE